MLQPNGQLYSWWNPNMSSYCGWKNLVPLFTFGFQVDRTTTNWHKIFSIHHSPTLHKTIFFIMSGRLPGAMVSKPQLGSPDPRFFWAAPEASNLTLRSIPPSERQVKNVSLIQPGHHVCLMTFNPTALYVPQKWLVIVTSHDFPGVQKCPRNVNPNMGKTMMLWSHLI